ncbi:MAG: hypothetical protein WDO73_32790 [Ignavibacteriota bacterium]
MARLLASPLFHHSKHYPSFLRYVVNETLEGRGSHLKERALGVEVFGRGADYDTNADPVVRTSACEVRKRIAQYYHESGHEEEIRIDLASGSYIPEFRYPAPVPRPLALVDAPMPAPMGIRQSLQNWVRRKRMPLAIAGAIASLGGVVALLWVAQTPGPVERFWNPVWGNTESVMLALGTPPEKILAPTASSNPEDGLTFRDVMRADNLAFADALAMARIMGVTGSLAGRDWTYAAPQPIRSPIFGRARSFWWEPSTILGR